VKLEDDTLVFSAAGGSFADEGNLRDGLDELPATEDVIQMLSENGVRPAGRAA
jgi:hypothetical protein